MRGRVGLVFCSVFLQLIGKWQWPRAKSGLLLSKLAKPVGAQATSQAQCPRTRPLRSQPEGVLSDVSAGRLSGQTAAYGLHLSVPGREVCK